MVEYREPRSGIVVSSNGSPEGDECVARFAAACRAYEAAQRRWVVELRRQGVKMAHPDDGWVDRRSNSLYPVYSEFDDCPQMGDRIALGDHDKYRVVTVVRREPATLGGVDRLYFDG